jgi:hypothetical protein
MSVFGCVIIISPHNWKGRRTPFLAVRVQPSEPVDLLDLLGGDCDDSLRTFSVIWGDGIGVEFHTLRKTFWNQHTQDVIDELGADLCDMDDDVNDEERDVCTIVTCLGKLPLPKPFYEWFSKYCNNKNIY